MASSAFPKSCFEEYCSVRLIDIQRWRKTNRVVWSKNFGKHWVRQNKTNFVMQLFSEFLMFIMKPSVAVVFLLGNKYKNTLEIFSKQHSHLFTPPPPGSSGGSVHFVVWIHSPGDLYSHLQLRTAKIEFIDFSNLFHHRISFEDYILTFLRIRKTFWEPVG